MPGSNFKIPDFSQSEAPMSHHQNSNFQYQTTLNRSVLKRCKGFFDLPPDGQVMGGACSSLACISAKKIFLFKIVLHNVS